jgi:lipopolysaccharide/colanic/teichoic acid biosynthesis glycosyltransferase/nucleoside-diphosphate-sugar epimerase
MIKRVVDTVLAALGLIILAPLLGVIALLIKLDSAGPVFFRQERVGKDGRRFRIFKFRTMVDNAYRLGPRLTQKRDPRVTRVGLVLRWLKLDELPQLINVVSGAMSLVGPRPEDPHFVSLYTPEQREVLRVRPGVVGPSQILGRDELALYPEGVDTEQYYIRHILPQKLQTDLGYVRRARLWYDLTLLGHGLAVTILGSIKPMYFRFNVQKIAFLALDTGLSLLIYWGAFGLKFDWTMTPASQAYLAAASALIVLIRPLCFVYFGLYQNILRYLGTSEFVAVVKAVSVGTVLISAGLFLTDFRSQSRAVLAIDWMLLIVSLYGYRLFLKIRAENQTHPRSPALIVGANDTGEQLAGQLMRDPSLAYTPVGFLDDDLNKQGALIHGIKVLGTVQDLQHVARLKGVRMVLIPHPAQPTNGEVKEAVERCREAQLAYRVVPTLDHLLNGGENVNGGESAAEAVRVPTPAAEAAGTDAAGAPADPAREASSSRGRPTPRTVLVTGGAGYVGSWLVRKLLDRDYRVRVLDGFLYGGHGLAELTEHPRLELIDGDVRHVGSVARAVKGVDGVIALAALVGDAACDLDEEETVAINYESVRVLADACRKQGVPRVVFASSCSVYGANSDLVLNEGSWLNPVSLYARTRIQSEEFLLQHSESVGVVILRLATVFGLSPRMRFDLLVNTLTMHAVWHGKMQVFGGSQWRPNLHVQDAAEAFILGLEAPAAKVEKGVFNVGANENNHSILDVAKLVQRELPAATLEIKGDVTDPRDYRVSFDKIRSVLGFQPRFGVADGIREIAEALSAGSIAEPLADVYHNYRHLKAHPRHQLTAPARVTPGVAVANPSPA